MNKSLLQKIVATFGTEAVRDPAATYAKVLLHPDNSIAVYFVNAHGIRDDLVRRQFVWEPLLEAWVKNVATIEDVQAETRGYPVTAAAFGR